MKGILALCNVYFQEQKALGNMQTGRDGSKMLYHKAYTTCLVTVKLKLGVRDSNVAQRMLLMNWGTLTYNMNSTKRQEVLA